MAQKALTELVSELAAPIAEKNGLSLWDVEYLREAGERILRVSVDRESGVSIDDCEAVSRALEKELDRLDPIAENYLLEISSAGLTRKLKKPAHFRLMQGRRVEVGLYKGEPLVGILKPCDGDPIIIEKDGLDLSIPAAGAAFARLYFEF